MQKKKKGRIKRNGEWEVTEVIIAQKGAGMHLSISRDVFERVLWL